MPDEIARDTVEGLSDAFDHLDAVTAAADKARASLERAQAAIIERSARRIKTLEQELAKDRGAG